MSYVLKVKQETAVVILNEGKKETKLLLSNTKYLIDNKTNEQAKILSSIKGNLVRPATQSEESTCEYISLF